MVQNIQVYADTCRIFRCAASKPFHLALQNNFETLEKLQRKPVIEASNLKLKSYANSRLFWSTVSLPVFQH